LKIRAALALIWSVPAKRPTRRPPSCASSGSSMRGAPLFGHRTAMRCTGADSNTLVRAGAAAGPCGDFAPTVFPAIEAQSPRSLEGRRGAADAPAAGSTTEPRNLRLPPSAGRGCRRRIAASGLAGVAARVMCRWWMGSTPRRIRGWPYKSMRVVWL